MKNIGFVFFFKKSFNKRFSPLFGIFKFIEINDWTSNVFDIDLQDFFIWRQHLLFLFFNFIVTMHVHLVSVSHVVPAFVLFYFNESSNEESSPFQTKKFQIYKLITVRLMHGFQPLEHWDFTEKPHHFFFFRCSNAEIAITPFLTTTHFVDNFSVIKHIDINTSYQRCYMYCRCFIGILICKSWNVLRKVTVLEIGCTILTFFLC